MLSIGIIGLPNVGKSTLFNALTRSKQAEAQNYPFCTIEPNIGVVEVPDDRLAPLARISKSKKIVPTAIQFVDIAGLMKGASEGEGLGNKFLSHIREVDAIAHVVREFKDVNVTHVLNRLDPRDDADIINLELVLADLETVKNRLDRTRGRAKGVAAKDFVEEIAVLERILAHLETGRPARLLSFIESEEKIVQELFLLTKKPIMYIMNSDERPLSVPSLGEEREDVAPTVTICAKIEAELADLSPEDAKEYMKEIGMEQSGLDQMIVAGYRLLDLITFFTSGEPEARAWTVKRGAKGPEAAGVIHTDFIKGYIKADITRFEDFVSCGGWAGVKEQGKMQLVGKEYEMKDGDVAYFHVNA